jgi:hypothetical protein
VTTAAATVRCAVCETQRPASEVYEPVRGVGEYRCADTAACRRRVGYVGDPVGEFIASPPAAVPGAACAVCGAAGGAYERTPGVYVCIDRGGCAERAVEAQYLTAWGDSSADALISPADMRAMAAAAPPEIPPERTELDPAAMAALASQDALGRKRR